MHVEEDEWIEGEASHNAAVLRLRFHHCLVCLLLVLGDEEETDVDEGKGNLALHLAHLHHLEESTDIDHLMQPQPQQQPLVVVVEGDAVAAVADAVVVAAVAKQQ